MTPEQYIALYDKYVSGNSTPEEELLLMQYQDNFILKEEKQHHISLDDELIRKRILARIDSTIASGEEKSSKFKWWIAAAAIFTCLLTAGILFNKQQPDRLLTQKRPAPKNGIIKPGSNKAILTLGDGSDVVLNDAKNGEIAFSEQVSIKKVENGLLSYVANTKAGNNKSDALNTITIPRGGKYTVMLPDGTNVWLNSESSLTYPVAFNGTERKVKLKGEAYFEVTKNKQKPFLVEVSDVTVKVLGTHFNINAYKETADIKTTLLEGAVRMYNERSSILLVPGEQGTTGSSSNKIQAKKVDTDQVVAWKNGYFIFRDDNIIEVMNQISRWYDVEVEYRGNMQGKNFGGIYSKNKDIMELLKGFELTGNIHFRIEGRRIIVMS